MHVVIGVMKTGPRKHNLASEGERLEDKETEEHYAFRAEHNLQQYRPMVRRYHTRPSKPNIYK